MAGERSAKLSSDYKQAPPKTAAVIKEAVLCSSQASYLLSTARVYSSTPGL